MLKTSFGPTLLSGGSIGEFGPILAVALLVPIFTVVFLPTRGVPTFAFFRHALDGAQLKALSILSATGLPLIVVITTIGVDEQRMRPQNASALVAAGMLSVLIYPMLGLRQLRPPPALPPATTRRTATLTKTPVGQQNWGLFLAACIVRCP